MSLSTSIESGKLVLDLRCFEGDIDCTCGWALSALRAFPRRWASVKRVWSRKVVWSSISGADGTVTLLEKIGGDGQLMWSCGSRKGVNTCGDWGLMTEKGVGLPGEYSLGTGSQLHLEI